jgi:hypothetical protein
VDEWDFLSRLVPGGGSDFPIANPLYFAVGAQLIYGALAFSLLGIIGATFRPSKRRRLAISIFAPCATFVLVFFVSHWHFRALIYETTMAAVFAAVANAIVTATLSRSRSYQQVSTMKQAASLLMITLTLGIFGLFAGDVRARGAFTHGERSTIRLVVAPEAMQKAEELGLTFSGIRNGSPSAQLSDPVQSLFEGDRTYVLRLKGGAIVHLNKDKVWGTTP